MKGVSHESECKIYDIGHSDSAWRPAGNAETDLCVAILRDSAGCAFWNLYSEKDSGAEAAGDRI